MVKKTEDQSKSKQSVSPNEMLKGLTKNMSKEQMQQLMIAMQKQQLASMPKHKRYFTQFMQYIGPKMQTGVNTIDGLIKFISKPTDEGRNEVMQSARGPILFGMWVAILFFGFAFMWAAIAPLDSASPAIGVVKSSTEKKTIQHKDGGIIKEIAVKLGDKVKKGQVLFRLDDTSAKTEYESSLSAFRSLKAEESRLKSERDGLPYILFSSKILKDSEKYEVAKIIETQRQVFLSKRSVQNDEKKLLMQKIEQHKQTVEGLKEKKLSSSKNRKFLEERLKSHKSLFEKGIISKAQMSEVESKHAEAKAQDIITNTDIAKNEQEVTSLEIQLHRQQEAYLDKALEDLKAIQSKLGEAEQRYIKAKDVLERTIVKAPVEGTINKIVPTTIGGVIAGGAELAEISPEKDFLIIEARIKPQDIGYIAPGMKAKIKFQAFKSRTTPTFTGIVTSLSPDVIIERGQNVENTYYVAKIEVDRKEFDQDAKRLNLKLIPGMQADIQIVRGTRTLLRYLLDPITDHMFRAFVEK